MTKWHHRRDVVYCEDGIGRTWINNVCYGWEKPLTGICEYCGAPDAIYVDDIRAIPEIICQDNRCMAIRHRIVSWRRKANYTHARKMTEGSPWLVTYLYYSATRAKYRGVAKRGQAIPDTKDFRILTRREHALSGRSGPADRMLEISRTNLRVKGAWLEHLERCAARGIR
jgi:hypothetical protein